MSVSQIVQLTNRRQPQWGILALLARHRGREIFSHPKEPSTKIFYSQGQLDESFLAILSCRPIQTNVACNTCKRYHIVQKYWAWVSHHWFLLLTNWPLVPGPDSWCQPKSTGIPFLLILLNTWNFNNVFSLQIIYFTASVLNHSMPRTS